MLEVTPQEIQLTVTLLLLLLVGAIVPVLTTVSAALIEKDQWEAARQSKALWVGLLVTGAALTPLVGTVVAAVYWVFVRPRLIPVRQAVTR